MLRCLLIDDDAEDQEVFQMCLRSLNAEIDWRGIDDSAEAIALLQQDAGYTPDYIFIDVNMPKINGVECLRKLKQIERLKNARMFMYSTTSGGPALAESLEAGAEDFIIKPARLQDLRRKLADLFGASLSIN